MKYAYVRVSTRGQDFDRQELILEQYNIPKENVYSEKISGTKRTNKRIGFEKLVQSVQKGDIIYFESMSRMARSLIDLCETTKMLVYERGVTVVFLKENMTINEVMSATDTLMFNILSSFAQFERDIISERTKDGLRAKREERGDDFNIGRKKGYEDSDVKMIKELREAGFTIDEIALDLSLSRSTIGRISKKLKEEAS